jgi:hypothetical protein
MGGSEAPGAPGWSFYSTDNYYLAQVAHKKKKKKFLTLRLLIARDPLYHRGGRGPKVGLHSIKRPVCIDNPGSGGTGAGAGQLRAAAVSTRCDCERDALV